MAEERHLEGRGACREEHDRTSGCETAADGERDQVRNKEGVSVEAPENRPANDLTVKLSRKHAEGGKGACLALQGP